MGGRWESRIKEGMEERQLMLKAFKKPHGNLLL